MNAFVPLRDRAHGQWRHICRAIGIDEKHLTGKNAPCPMCGGKDRFKFFDTGHNGTWFCRKCSPTRGGGADLVMAFTGRTFRDARRLIVQHLGEPIRPKPIRPAPDPRPKLRRMWAESKPTMVEKPRKIVSKHGNGPHVRLTPVAAMLGIAEGIETALAASRLFGIPTWSVLSTYGVETFEPPAEVNHLIIYADHDLNGAGQKAAYALAARLAGTITVEVKIPDKPGTDWNDVLR
jgi:phage/plasmid primase-like uncharacterized protein